MISTPVKHAHVDQPAHTHNLDISATLPLPHTQHPLSHSQAPQSSSQNQNPPATRCSPHALSSLSAHAHNAHTTATPHQQHSYELSLSEWLNITPSQVPAMSPPNTSVPPLPLSVPMPVPVPVHMPMHMQMALPPMAYPVPPPMVHGGYPPQAHTAAPHKNADTIAFQNVNVHNVYGGSDFLAHPPMPYSSPFVAYTHQQNLQRSNHQPPVHHQSNYNNSGSYDTLQVTTMPPSSPAVTDAHHSHAHAHRQSVFEFTTPQNQEHTLSTYSDPDHLLKNTTDASLLLSFAECLSYANSQAASSKNVSPIEHLASHILPLVSNNPYDRIKTEGEPAKISTASDTSDSCAHAAVQGQIIEMRKEERGSGKHVCARTPPIQQDQENKKEEESRPFIERLRAASPASTTSIAPTPSNGGLEMLAKMAQCAKPTESLESPFRLTKPKTSADNKDSTTLTTSAGKASPSCIGSTVAITDPITIPATLNSKIAQPAPRVSSSPLAHPHTTTLGSSPLSSLVVSASDIVKGVTKPAGKSRYSTPLSLSRPSSALSSHSHTKPPKFHRKYPPRRFAPSQLPSLLRLPTGALPTSADALSLMESQRGPLEFEREGHGYRTRSKLRTLKTEMLEREREEDINSIRRGVRQLGKTAGRTPGDGADSLTSDTTSDADAIEVAVSKGGLGRLEVLATISISRSKRERGKRADIAGSTATRASSTSAASTRARRTAISSTISAPVRTAAKRTLQDRDADAVSSISSGIETRRLSNKRARLNKTVSSALGKGNAKETSEKAKKEVNKPAASRTRMRTRASPVKPSGPSSNISLSLAPQSSPPVQSPTRPTLTNRRITRRDTLAASKALGAPMSEENVVKGRRTTRGDMEVDEDDEEESDASEEDDEFIPTPSGTSNKRKARKDPKGKRESRLRDKREKLDKDVKTNTARELAPIDLAVQQVAHNASCSEVNTSAAPADEQNEAVNTGADAGASIVYSARTFPADMPIHPTLPLLYRQFPVCSYLDPEHHESPGPLPVGHFNAPRSAGDLYTPRFVRGVGRDKAGLCPICYESKARGGNGKAEWLSMKFSAFNYHMQYAHGISPTTALPFSPPIAFRKSPRKPNHKNEKAEILEGLCHRCNEWAPVEGVKCVEAKLKEIYWWKHAAGCHKGSSLEGETDVHILDDTAKNILSSLALQRTSGPTINKSRSIMDAPQALPFIMN